MRVDELSVSETVAVAETAEAEFMYAFERGAPREAQEALGMEQARVGGGVVLVMAGDPTGGYWNKALGFGVTEPFTEDVARDVVDRYRRAGAPAGVLQLAPAALPEDWEDVSGRLGIVAGNVWAKLLRPADEPPAPAHSDLEVGPLDPGEAEAWARLFARGFGMPEHPSLLAMFAEGASSGQRSGFRPFGAHDGTRLVAAAQLFVHDGLGAFCGAATDEDARGRGAQSAFMQQRVEAAHAAGCTWLSSETWQESDGHHNPSLHNMERAGFVQVYDRVNWVWRP